MEVKDPSPQTTLLILLGASEWPSSPQFQSSEASAKAFANAAQGVRDYFCNPQPFGLPTENLLYLFDSEKGAGELDLKIEQFLKQRLADMTARGSAGRDLLLYFIGHGGFAGDDHDYYLAIRSTGGNLLASGLGVKALAYTLKEEARHLRRIIILDCCFAAAALHAFQGAPDQVALEKTIDAFRGGRKAEGFPTKGTTLFCSSNQKSPSQLLADYSSTMFTKAFLDVLTQGTPSQQDRLTLREVKDAARDLLFEIQDAPKPVVDSPDQSEGDVADIPFFPNPWFEKERLRRAEEERARLVKEEKERARLAEESVSPLVQSLQADRRPAEKEGVEEEGQRVNQSELLRGGMFILSGRENISYFLSTGIGIIGVALPIVLIFGRMILEGRLGILDSMSAYHQSVMRDVFVGSLWAIGICLICYRYDHLDDIVSTIAGAFAILVALFPNPPMHQWSAACFFLILALMAIFLFRRTDQEKPKRRKRQRNTVYLICGIAIVLCLVLIVVVNFLPGNSWLQPLHPILVLEALASFAFGFAWIVKGGTILKEA